MVRKLSTLSLSLLFLLVCPLLVTSQERLDPDVVFEGIESGRFDGVWDVRNQAEWDEGHLPNATHVENLASSGNADDLTNCDNCTLLVYCKLGGRAATAIDRLINEYNFTGTLFNGQGVDYYTDANYTLVQGDSIDPLCKTDNTQCTCCDGRAGEDSVDDDSASGGNMFVAILATLLLIPFL